MSALVRGQDGASWFDWPIRVEYHEVDAGGVAHHAVFLRWFERGRTEMLRALGVPYAGLEAEGARIVVVESRTRHRAPAVYDDLLRVRTRVSRLGRVRIVLEYRVEREGSGDLLCEGETTLAVVDGAGRPRELPRGLEAALASRRSNLGL
jgi:acyl-CoA thioester hydrolase